MAGKTDDIAPLAFEDALKQLEDIVQQLESGNVPLDKSIELYERGEKLKSHCEKLLSSAEARIEKIKLSANGKPKSVEPMDPEA